MPQDQDQFDSGHRDTIFNASERLCTDDVSRHTNRKNVPDSEIENQLRGNARIDATEYNGQGILSGRGSVDLTTEIPRDPVSRVEAFITLAQDLQDLSRCDAILKLPRRVVSELNLVVQLLLFPEPPQAHADATRRCFIVLEVTD